MTCYVISTDSSNIENQDRACVVQQQVITIGLADGAGGLSGGTQAAQHIVNALQETPVECANILLQQLDYRIEQDPMAGETTAIVIKIQKHQIIGASVGDSAAWLINKGQVIDLTQQQQRKPLLGSGRATPISFSHHVATGLLLVASDGLVKYASTSDIMQQLSNQHDLTQCSRQLIELVRFPSGQLPDDVTIILLDLSQVSYE